MTTLLQHMIETGQLAMTTKEATITFVRDNGIAVNNVSGDVEFFKDCTVLKAHCKSIIELHNNGGVLTDDEFNRLHDEMVAAAV